ncbi:MAG: hypothetical protein WC289_00815 [Patescibacteria group bacterium]|jgi:hypothetical protein
MNRREQGMRVESSQEGERKPRLEIMITRHANRTPTGELTPEGVQAMQDKGRSLAETAEIVKGRSSREKTDRAFKTVDSMSRESGTASPLTGEHYSARRREGLFYDVAGPLKSHVDAQTAIIDAAVKKDHPDYDPADKKWAKIRETYQPVGMENMVNDPEIMHILAMGMASNVQQAEKTGAEYIRKRTGAVDAQRDSARPIEKDIVMPIGTHAGFSEAFIKKTLIRTTADGERRGFDATIDDDGNAHMEKAVGGIFAPTESIRFGHEVGESAPDRMPVTFENNRFEGEGTFIDNQAVAKLAEQYRTYRDLLDRWNRKEVSEQDFEKELGALMQEYAEWEDNKSADIAS